MLDRAAALVGAAVVVVALVLVWLSRVAAGRDVYVSELGADGMPTAAGFRVALVVLVVGGLLIAVAARRVRARGRILSAWPPAVTLVASCAGFLVTAAVPCTAGCPVPVPFSVAFTWQDFTHTGVAVLAFAAASWAMLQCSTVADAPALRHLSLGCAIAVAAVAATGGLMSVFSWNTDVGSRLEYVATSIGVAWIAVLGASTGLRRSAAPSASATAGSRAAFPARSAPLHEVEQPIGE